MPIIYCTTNKINGKKYIGADSKNDSKYFGSGLAIKLAIKKYGRSNFYKKTIEKCSSINEMYKREEYWIDFFGAVNSKKYYNLSKGGKGGNKLDNPKTYKKWKKNTPPIKEITQKYLKGKSYKEIYGENAEKQKNKRSVGLIGKKYTIERCKNISESLKGKIPWNKGLTKETNDIVKKYAKNRKRKPYKKYNIISPEGKKFEFIGRKSLGDFFKCINAKLPRKSRININLLIKNKELKNYKIK